MKPLILVLVVAVLAACSSPSASLVGTWLAPDQKYSDSVLPVKYTFAINGTGTVEHFGACYYCKSIPPNRVDPITWSVDGDKVTIVQGGTGEAYTYKIQGDQLQMSPVAAAMLGGAATSSLVYVYSRAK